MYRAVKLRTDWFNSNSALRLEVTIFGSSPESVGQTKGSSGFVVVDTTHSPRPVAIPRWIFQGMTPMSNERTTTIRTEKSRPDPDSLWATWRPISLLIRCDGVRYQRRWNCPRDRTPNSTIGHRSHALKNPPRFSRGTWAVSHLSTHRFW